MQRKSSCARVTEMLMKTIAFSATVVETKSDPSQRSVNSPKDYWLNVLAFLTVVVGLSAILTTPRLKKGNQALSVDENIITTRRKM